MDRNIFKKEGFWGKKKVKIHIYGFMIFIAIVAYFVSNSGGIDKVNLLNQVTTGAIVDNVEEEVEILDYIILEKGEVYEVGDKTFLVNKIDKETHIRNYAANGLYWIFTFTVTSDKPYVPEPRIISGNNVLAPDEVVQKLYTGKVLYQVNGETRGLKVFDIPKDFDEIYLDFDIGINSTLYKIR